MNSYKGEKNIASSDLLIVPISKYVGRDSNHVQSGLFLLGFKILCPEEFNLLHERSKQYFTYTIYYLKKHTS